MAAQPIDVHYVAHLARLAISSEEAARFAPQIESVLGYIEKLKELDVGPVEPMAHAVPLFNVSRPDEVRPSLSNEEALANAPATAQGLFLTPKIVE